MLAERHYPGSHLRPLMPRAWIVATRLPSVLPLTIAAATTVSGTAYGAAQLQVCVRQDSTTDHEEFDAIFAKGAVYLPAGTVFDWAGHTFGGAADPLDGKHSLPGAAPGWRGVSKAEDDRRGKLLVEDAGRNQRRTTGLVTLATARLTKAAPCTLVAVAAVLSPAWGWTVAPVFEDPGIYYQTYGVVRGGRLNTDWSKELNSFGVAATAGAVNGVLQGTTDRVIEVTE